MSNSNVQVPLSTLNSKIKSRFHLYCILSRKYKLPEFSSRAITSNYLKSYLLAPCPVFRIERTEFHPPFIIHRHVNATEVLNTIEKELKKKNFPPTGLDEEKLPDFDWLVGVYFHLSPKDDYQLFPRTIKQADTVTRTISEELIVLSFKKASFFKKKFSSLIVFRLAVLIQEEDVKKHGRSMFQLQEEEKKKLSNRKTSKKG